MPETNACPVCESRDVTPFFALPQIPVNVGVQWPSREAAVGCPRGDIELAFCGECGFIYNRSFDPALIEYTQAYENPLSFSPYFRAYARQVASRLIERYDLREKDIIEIGCGKGDFLSLLCELGNNRGVGFDPSYDSARVDRKAAERFTVIKDLYSERYAGYTGDLICWRYVFEHIDTPAPFLRMVRATIGDRSTAVVYVEVPDVLFILRDLSVWDIIYEHCSYFSPASLARVFARCDFAVCDIVSQYEGQYLGLEARPARAGAGSGGAWSAPGAEIGELVAAFSDNYRRRIESWTRDLAALGSGGRKAVLWGAGAKGVGFLNLLRIDDQIPYVVDINPHKHGTYIAGTGQEIVAPAFLREYRPDTVIVTNPVYRGEIEEMLKGLGIATEFMDV